jgi:hypothetical protein
MLLIITIRSRQTLCISTRDTEMITQIIKEIYIYLYIRIQFVPHIGNTLSLRYRDQPVNAV